MSTQSLRQLITVLRGCLRGGNHTRALRLLVTNLPRTEGHYLLRRSVAEILLDMGRTREALEIYEILVRHFTNSGHPLLAIIVAHRLAEHEPNIHSHFDHLSRVYGNGSPFLDPSVQMLPLPDPPASARIDLNGADPQEPLEILIERAHGLATLKDNFAAVPDKVPPIPLLSLLDVRTLRTLIELLRPASFVEEATIFGPDRPLKAPLFVANGDLRLTTDDKHQTVSTGALIGHRTILGLPNPTGAIVGVALSPVEALTLDDDTLPMVQGDASIRQTVEGFDQACLIDKAIDRSGIFSKIPVDHREELIGMMEGLALRDNTTLIHQGQNSDGLYLIVDGRIDVNKRDGEWDVTFRTMEIGEVIGEISLVTEGPAVASVVTDGPARALFIKASDVMRICERFPAVMAELRESAAKRLLSREA